MKELLILAYKNIFRQKTRSFITFTSIFLGAFLAVVGASMTDGTHEFMIQSVLNIYTSDIQIHKKGYRENQTLDFAITGDYQSLLKKIGSHVDHPISPRLEFTALISNRDSVGASVAGIDPTREGKVTGILKHIVKGRSIRKGNEIIIGKEMAKLLNVKPGDRVVLLTQGAMGMLAVDLFKVVGIFDLIQPDANTYMAFIPLPAAQHFLNLPGITTIAVKVPLHQVKRVQEQLKKLLGNDFEVLRWDEIMPDLKEMMEMDSAFGLYFMAVLMIILALGVMETLILNIHERVREIGLLMALGMKPLKLIMLFLFEGAILSFTGTISGSAMGYLLSLYYHNHPIYIESLKGTLAYWGVEPYLYFSITSPSMWQLPLLLLVSFILFMIFPVNQIIRMNPVKALRFNK